MAENEINIAEASAKRQFKRTGQNNIDGLFGNSCGQRYG